MIPTPRSLDRSPVSLRLYKVLGANYSDESIVEALNTLSELYAAPSASAKGKEVQHAHEDDFDGKELTGGGISDGLSFLESLPPGETAARARKNLRRDIENKLAEGSQKFLKAFGEVDQVCICSSLFLWLALFGTRRVDVASWFNSETGCTSEAHHRHASELRSSSSPAAVDE